jgi:hypothetical protein
MRVSRARLTGLDEARQRRDALLLGVESAVPEPVGGDEDERSGHEAPSSLFLVLSFCCARGRNSIVLWLSVIITARLPVRSRATRPRAFRWDSDAGQRAQPLLSQGADALHIFSPVGPGRPTAHGFSAHDGRRKAAWQRNRSGPRGPGRMRLRVTMGTWKQ